jgi:uncharacterized protein DUF6843
MTRRCFLSLTRPNPYLAVLLGCGIGCSQVRRPNQVLVPDGYVGWIQIIYNVPDAPELSKENGSYIIKLPPSGRLKTSSRVEYGWARDEFYSYSGTRRTRLNVTGWGGGGMVWAGAIEGSSPNQAMVYFIGSEAMFKKQEGHAPKLPVGFWDHGKG